MKKIGNRVTIVICPKCKSVIEYTAYEEVLYNHKEGDTILLFKCPECKEISQCYTPWNIVEDGAILKDAIKFGDKYDYRNLSADRYKFLEEIG